MESPERIVRRTIVPAAAVGSVAYAARELSREPISDVEPGESEPPRSAEPVVRTTASILTWGEPSKEPSGRPSRPWTRRPLPRNARRRLPKLRRPRTRARVPRQPRTTRGRHARRPHPAKTRRRRGRPRGPHRAASPQADPPRADGRAGGRGPRRRDRRLARRQAAGSDSARASPRPVVRLRPPPGVARSPGRLGARSRRRSRAGPRRPHPGRRLSARAPCGTPPRLRRRPCRARRGHDRDGKPRSGGGGRRARQLQPRRRHRDARTRPRGSQAGARTTSAEGRSRGHLRGRPGRPLRGPGRRPRRRADLLSGRVVRPRHGDEPLLRPPAVRPSGRRLRARVRPRRRHRSDGCRSRGTRRPAA